MSFLEGAGLELGIGIAIGMLAGHHRNPRLGARPDDAAGRRDRPRGRLSALRPADLDSLLGALFCLVGAVFGCIVVSDVVSGAGRREGGGSGALGFLSRWRR